MITRQKHDDKFRSGLKLLPIVFGPEGVDVASHPLGMINQPCRADILIACFTRGSERFERCFGVDHDPLAARKSHHQVSAKIARGFLFAEVTIWQHFGHLDDAAQLQLPPASGVCGRTKCGG